MFNLNIEHQEITTTKIVIKYTINQTQWVDKKDRQLDDEQTIITTQITIV